MTSRGSRESVEMNGIGFGITGFENTDFAYISSEMKCSQFLPQKEANSFRVSGGWNPLSASDEE